MSTEQFKKRILEGEDVTKVLTEMAKHPARKELKRLPKVLDTLESTIKDLSQISDKVYDLETQLDHRKGISKEDARAAREAYRLFERISDLSHKLRKQTEYSVKYLREQLDTFNSIGK